jgi:hypothetical protein
MDAFRKYLHHAHRIDETGYHSGHNGIGINKTQSLIGILAFQHGITTITKELQTINTNVPIYC